MSSQRGNVNKSAQKHRNNIAFKLDKYGTSPRIEKVKQAPTDGMCPRCRDIIEWRKKYDKYKLLTKPAKCLQCGEKNIRRAYCVLCIGCAKNANVCAKCGEHHEELSFALSKEQKRQQELEEERLQRSMRERERRAYHRQQEKLSRERADECQEGNGEDRDSGPVPATSDPDSNVSSGGEDEEAEEPHVAATSAATLKVAPASVGAGDSLDWEDTMTSDEEEES